ncbi:MAG: type ISP restriction/modification enzyme [Armatimonadota bacterium]
MRAQEPLERYLQGLRDIRATGAGVKEESFYGVLESLLNEVGKALKPKVRCVSQLRNVGAGEPDFGLFTEDQFQRGAEDPLPGQRPARGVIEVKAPEEAMEGIIESQQVLRYLNKYGLVLVTNYREFSLVGVGTDGRPVVMETCALADSLPAFRQLTAQPRKAADELHEPFFEFLRRALLFNAPLSAPKDVAWFLASYAREARGKMEQAELPALSAVRRALEEALGMTFQGEKGEHFFRSTLVQTLFYGIFSAWVLWQQRGGQRGGKRFDWRLAGYELHVPMIQVLYTQLSQPQRLRPLKLEDILEKATELLNRVDTVNFFAQFSQEHAVQYFYEPFLQAFDPDLRKELGVWYTPPEIVQYMVARVDAVLRDELGIADGLADPDVYVLDPCCGTGAYLVEVLRFIHRTLEARGMGALSELTLKKAAMSRIFGFEILPAPFVIAHLQLGLLLHTLGDELTATDERVGVYLTNSLTGWEPPNDEAKRKLDQLAMFSPEIRQEHDAAAQVKRHTPLLVILGNPPYNGFAGMALDEERDLSNAYRATKKAPAPQGQGLNDLYVRFYRMAERQIVERSHRGVVCFISNYSWLDGLSFTGMRERYLEAFDHIWIDCLNGDKYKTGKLTPDGLPDPSVFSTDWNREGIQVGTAIGLLVRSGKEAAEPTVDFRHFWGKSKREDLLASLEKDGENGYMTVDPPCGLGFPFSPATVEADYLSWPLLPELFPVSFPGVKTSRDDMLVDIDRERLVARMEKYFDPAVSNEEITRFSPAIMEDKDRFHAKEIRDFLLKRGMIADNFVRYQYRPFDCRWLYWEPETKLLDEKRSEYFPNIFPDNKWLSAGQRNRKDVFYQPQVTSILADHHLVESNVGMFPLRLKDTKDQHSLFESSEEFIKENLSTAATDYFSSIEATGLDLFHHIVACLHAPLYRNENAGALRQDWPRIPLPASRAVLLDTAGLGRRIAALLDTESPVDRVTCGKLREELRPIAVPSRVDGGNLRAEDLAVTAGWGHAGQGGVTMPGKGKPVERDYTPAERAAFRAAGLTDEDAAALLGNTTFDIYLNDAAYWRNVPARVWSYTLGGYQVMKKWLSYREQNLLGRPLTQDEVFEVTNMARRIAALLLLEPVLDRLYQQVKAETYTP